MIRKEGKKVTAFIGTLIFTDAFHWTRYNKMNP
jgi:hypothetical protein